MTARTARARSFASLLERARGQDLPADEILQAIVEAVARAMGTEVATLYVYDARADELVLAATRGLPRAAVGFVTLQLGEGCSGRSALERVPIAVPDVADEPSFKMIAGFDQSRYRSMLVVPVLSGEALLGALNVQTVMPHPYTPRDAQDLTTIAAALAAVLVDLLDSDLHLRLRGPSVLSELDGIVAATQGSADISARLVARLRLLFPDVRCAVALAHDDGSMTLTGDELAPPAQEALQRCARRAVAESRAEGGALLALPLIAGSRTLGALVISAADGSWRDGFDPYQVGYVEALARQVSVALERSALSSRQLRQHNGSTEGLLRYDELTRMVLDDAGLDALVARTAEMLGAPVAVVDAAGVLIAGERPEAVRSTIDLRAGDSFLGRLIGGVAAGEPALVAAGRVIALELVKWKVRFDVETRLRGDVLDLLMSGSWDDERQMGMRAGLAGVDLSRTYVPVLFAFDTDRLAQGSGALALRAFERDLRRQCGEPPTSVAFVRPEGVLLLADPAARRVPLERIVAKALTELQRLGGGMTAGAGIGPGCTRLSQYGAAVRQALMAARLGQRMHATLPVDATRLGAFRLLLALDDEAPLREFVEDNLGPLLRQDTDIYGAELVKTLEAYHASGERLRPAAAALFIHVNTLKYRLSRIETLIGRELTDATARLDLYLALYALRLLEPERDSLLPNNIAAPFLAAADEAS